MAEELVKALRQMPVDELRAQMPELEQLLTTVKHQSMGGAGGSMPQGGATLVPGGGGGGGGAAVGAAVLGGGMFQPQAAHGVHQLRAAGSSAGGQAAAGVDYSYFPGANLTSFSPSRMTSGLPLGGVGGSRPLEGPAASAAAGVSAGRSAEETAEEARFGHAISVLQESAQRGAPARRGGRGPGGMNKVPVVEGAELEAYAPRGPMTIIVGRNGEMSSMTRGRGNWRRGMSSASSVGRVKIGKGGFARGVVPAGGAGSEVDLAGAEGAAEGEVQVRKRAKRGEGPRANRVRRDPEAEGFKCCYCHNDATFATREELQEHKDKMHTGQKQTKQTMPCPVCALPCKDKHLLAIHMRIHTGERPYQCTKCPAKFRSTSGLNAHLRKHAGLERSFVCFCGEQFSSRCSVARHQETVHKTAAPQTCPTCGVSFPGPITLQAHKRKVHGEMQSGQTARKKSSCYQCDKCDRSFHRELTLLKHMNVDHGGIQPYTCAECGESFSTAFKYKAHMEQHNPDQLLTRKICCPVCPSRFQNQRQLVGHMLCKHPDQPQAESLSLKCKFCDKQMKNYNQLQQHELEHREDWKGFECKELGCGQFFKTRYLLTKHQVVHKGSNLTCQQCDRTFANEASFKNHLKLHESKKERGEEIKIRGNRQRQGDDGGDKSPRKRHRSTGRPKGRPRKHPRPEDGDLGEGAGSGDGGDNLEGGSDPLNALVYGALKSKKARGRPPKAGGEAEDLEGRSGKRRKTAAESGEDTVGEHVCTKCGAVFAIVYDMYEHMRDCRGPSLAVGVGVLRGVGGSGMKKAFDQLDGPGALSGSSSAKTLPGMPVGSSRAAGVLMPGVPAAEPHLQNRVAELEAELAEMKAQQALAAAAATSAFAPGAAAAATSAFAQGAWRDPPYSSPTLPPPPPPSNPLPSQPPPPPILEKGGVEGDKDMEDKDGEKGDEDDMHGKDVDDGKAK